MGQSELQVLVRVHHVLVSLQLAVLHHSRLDDLDRTVASTVRSSHLLVALLHRAQKGHITVLLVHVVGSRARVVAQPNTEVLHLRSRLVDLPSHSPSTTHLVHSQNLSGSVLHLLQSVHEVPVAGLGSHRVGSEQSHSVDLRLGVRLGGESAANDLIVVNLHHDERLALGKSTLRCGKERRTGISCVETDGMIDYREQPCTSEYGMRTHFEKETRQRM